MVQSYKEVMGFREQIFRGLGLGSLVMEIGG